MSTDDAAGLAVTLVSFLAIVGILVFALLERRVDKRINHLARGPQFRFECTCGWSGWRSFPHRPVSIKCPNCNGIAVQIDYRGREE